MKTEEFKLSQLSRHTRPSLRKASSPHPRRPRPFSAIKKQILSRKPFLLPLDPHPISIRVWLGDLLRNEEGPRDLDDVSVIVHGVEPGEEVFWSLDECLVTGLVVWDVCAQHVWLGRRGATSDEVEDIETELPFEEADFDGSGNPGEFVDREEDGCRVEVVSACVSRLVIGACVSFRSLRKRQLGFKRREE